MNKLSNGLHRLSQCERLNFLLTNRIPRRWTTLLMGRLSRVENPVFTKPAFAAWRFFAGDFRLHEAKETRFKSLHDCFTRELKPGVRPIDERPGVVVSPCDAVVGRFGGVQGVEVLQAKGYPYSLRDLLGDSGLVEKYRDGVYVTLRLKSNMYHRFHAPVSGEIRKVTYIAGDTWNVNPIALRRIESLFCKNERAVLEIDPRDASKPLLLVPVAAILVASMKFNFLPETLDLNYGGPTAIKCAHSFNKGDELGFFRQGSTIIVFGSAVYRIDPALREGQEIEMGRLLLYDDTFRAAFQGRSTGL